VKKAGIVLLILGILTGFGSYGAVSYTLINSLHGGKQISPTGSTTLSLSKGEWAVYDGTGKTGVFGVASDQTAHLSFRSIQVTDASGARVQVMDMGNESETTTKNGVSYTAVAKFSVKSKGSYTVTVASDGSSRVLVGRTLVSSFKRLLIFVVPGFVAFVLFVVGLVLAIVGSRNGKDGNRSTFIPSGPAPPAVDSAGVPRWLDSPPS
jgi:hypothetical protein